MIEFLVLLCAFISGALLYFALRKDIEEFLFVRIEKNIFFPILIIILMCSGVYITQYIHLEENALRSSNGQENVSVMGCIIENIQDCQTITNKLNNDTYTQLQSGTIQSGNFYIPFSLQNSIINNPLSYFCGGVIFIWLVLFFSTLRVKK